MTTFQKFSAVPLIAGALAVGIALASYTSIAFAQSESGTSTQTVGGTQSDPHPPAGGGGHVGKNGVKEQILTGDAAQKATAAALLAVPGGTIERVENDAEGDAYEAHMTKPDGSRVTVKFDPSFHVTKTEDGPGPRNSSATDAV